ncbi:MAG: alpha/beta hydrolase [Rhodothermales bacterium]|nr:alpha/beta hydrolase [Rhodothermales bacterium]
MSDFSIAEHNGYRYVDEGPATSAPPVVLLHGMLGDQSNWYATIRDLAKKQYRVIVPVLPVYDLPLSQTTVPGLVDYVHGFTEALGIPEMVLAGNSLGGHVALLYAVRHPEKVSALVLSGASGIYEVEMGTSKFRRRDRDYIRQRAALTFFDPAHATDDLVEDVYGIINDRGRAIRLIRMARSVQNEGVAEHLGTIHAPTLLVWGEEDVITPPDVAEAFFEGIPNARLQFIGKCGHAPMIEHPDVFNEYTLEFLDEVSGKLKMAM